jgi:voltage-gated potassium channel
MRRKIYGVINSSGECLAGKIYDFIMMAAIVASLVPLAFKGTNLAFVVVDYISVSIFIVDYVLRLVTADIKLGRSVTSFFVYPITPMAIVDLVSILPSLAPVNGSLKLLKLFRLLRTLKVLRSLKFLRYSKSFDIIVSVFKKQKKVLSAVMTMAVAYIVVSALVIYNVEPDSFKSFFEAVYWATVSLTTVGYGDIYPVTVIGRVITMASSIFGVAVIALPSGVITAGYLAEMNGEDKENKEG